MGSWRDSWTSRMTVVCQALGMREILRGMRVRNHRPRRLATVLFHTRETLVPRPRDIVFHWRWTSLAVVNVTNEVVGVQLPVGGSRMDHGVIGISVRFPNGRTFFRLSEPGAIQTGTTITKVSWTNFHVRSICWWPDGAITRGNNAAVARGAWLGMRGNWPIVGHMCPS